MMMLGTEKERRRCRRYQVQEGAFAFIENTPFTIQNISEGGMMLQSVVFDGTPEEHLQLDIFLKDEELYLKNIPVRLVNHKKSKPITPFSAIQVKYYSIAFDNPDEQQRDFLDSLMKNYTVGEA